MKDLNLRNQPAQLFPFVLIASLLLRLYIAFNAEVHQEEGRLLIAIDATAHRGIPLLGSDVLFLQGTPLTYLFAPLNWIASGVDYLYLVRFGNAILATLAVGFVWHLSWAVSRNLWITAGVAIASAFDPFSLVESTLATPWALHTLLTVIAVHAAIRTIQEPDAQQLRRLRTTNPLLWLLAAMVLGSFTHYSIWLIAAAIAVVFILKFGKSLADPLHPVQQVAQVAIVAPILVWLLTGWVGPNGANSVNPGAPNFPLVWDNLASIWKFDGSNWRNLYHVDGFAGTLTTLIALCSGVLAYRCLRQPSTENLPVVLILITYWSGLVIASDAVDPAQFSGLIPLGYLIVGLAVLEVTPDWNPSISRTGIRMNAQTALSILLLIPFVVYLITGALDGLQAKSRQADYIAASDYVADILQPGQFVLTPLPELSWFELPQNIILPIAGITGSARERDRTRGTDNQDYWTGQPSITKVPELCAALRVTPAPVIIMDEGRLYNDSAFSGEFAEVLAGSTVISVVGEYGLMILQVKPLNEWSDVANQKCATEDTA